MRSDNICGISEPILKALGAANTGNATGYGDDDLTVRMEEKLRDVFEKPDLKAYGVVTGTAANSLALSAITPPYGAVFCHEGAHIEKDECGAPEFYTGGAKLTTLPGEGGRFQPADLKIAFDQSEKGFVHSAQVSAASLSQTTELGTIYPLSDIEKIAAITHDNNCHLHMDGARFANALVSLGCSPAEMTWKAGVDVLSFGATKNGAMAAECVIFFNPELANDFEYRRKRGGHLISKMRFVSAQMLAYLENDHWLDNARHANKMAQRLADGIGQVEGLEVSFPVQSNMVFMEMPQSLADLLHEAGFPFYYFHPARQKYARLVTSFSSREEEIDHILQVMKSWAS